jgi:hypothetical protein
VPTEKDKACAWTNSGNNRKIPDKTTVRAYDLSIDLQEADEDTAKGMI